MERAQPLEVAPSALQGHRLLHHVHDAQAGLDLFDAVVWVGKRATFLV
jgi:hypothetical protein